MSMCVSDWTAFSTQTVRTFTVKNRCICSPASCFDSLHYIMTLECDESSECEYFTSLPAVNLCGTEPDCVTSSTSPAPAAAKSDCAKIKKEEASSNFSSSDPNLA